MYCITNKNGTYYIPEGSPGCITDNDCVPGLVCSNMGYKQLVCQKKLIFLFIDLFIVLYLIT